MSAVRVSYITTCLWFLMALFLLCSPMLFLAKGHVFAICFLFSISSAVGVVAYGFGRRRKWAWYYAWVIGVLTLVLAGCIFWAAAHASTNGDGGEVWIIAFIMFGFAIPALWVMLTSDLQGYLHPSREADSLRE